MRQALERNQSALDDLVRSRRAELGHEADTTSVVVRGVARMGHRTLLAKIGVGCTTQNFDEGD
jgi:hypothetical protein